jgi:4-hydroxybenzoate polyprenyltransferase
MKKLLAVLQLLRLPNVFTAMADIFMGFLISHGSLEPLPEFFLLLFASSCIYLSGMVLNDWFDLEIDRQERPERPLPSGRIQASHALVAGVGLILLGIALATAAGRTSRNVALILAATVVAYDSALKNTILGAAAMGLCRALNVVLAMSTQPGTIWLLDLGQSHGWRFGTMVAAGVGLYIMGVTRFARREVSGGARAELLSSTLGFNLGLLLVAMSTQALRSTSINLGPDIPYWFVSNVDPGVYSWPVRAATAAALWGSVVVVTNTMVYRGIWSGEPRMIQQAVKTCILALIALDAAVVAYVAGPVWAAVVLTLLAPTITLGRWVYST